MACSNTRATRYILVIALCAASVAALTPSARAAEGELKAELSANTTEFSFVGWPLFDFQPFRVRMVVRWTGDAPISLLRYNDAIGVRGDIACEVIGPNGKAVAPFEWMAAEKPAEDGSKWGSKPEHYVTLAKGEAYEFDLSTAFFDERDAAYPTGERLTMTPVGPRRYGLLIPGEYTIRVTYSHPYDGADASGKKLTANATWRGKTISNDVKIKLVPTTVRSGSAEGHMRHAAKGPKVKAKAATYFGGEGNEEFVSVGEQPDGTVVAFGNVWGPTMPALPVQPTVLGEGKWFDVSPFPGGQGVELFHGKLRLAELETNYPNKAGVIIRYSGDLQKVISATRFDWGMANILSGVIVPTDGTMFICGQSTEFFRKFAAKSKVCQTFPVVKQPGMGPINYQGTWLPGDAYIAKLTADGTKVLWAYLFEGHRGNTRIWPDKEGGVSLQISGQKGIWHISADGGSVEKIEIEKATTRQRILTLNPFTREFLQGGDYFNGTGREPWRRPYLYGYDKAGYFKWEAYAWPGPLVGHDWFRLVSDSAVRVAAFSRKGTLWISGWSDGGNTVLSQDPFDLTKGVPRDKFGMNLAGVGAGSFPHIVHMNPDTGEVYCYLLWTSFLKRKGADGNWIDCANSLKVDYLLPLDSGAVAFAGSSTSFLIQTPNAWYRRADVDWPEGIAGGYGRFICIFDKELANPLFCSAVPGVTTLDMCETRQGIAIVARTAGLSSDNQFIPPVNAVQPRYGGGRCDGMIILMEKPVDGIKP